MIRIEYKSVFVRTLKKCPIDIQEEAVEKIELLKDVKNHERLRVHKLHAPYKNCYSFSVNFRIRIVFEYLDKSTIVLLAIGDHDMYQ